MIVLEYKLKGKEYQYKALRLWVNSEKVNKKDA
jgi:hypothetical protein